jgi:uncharacterized protein (TIGR03437 family)
MSLGRLLLLPVVLATVASGLDNANNGWLNGPYFVRHVIALDASPSNEFARMRSFSGVMEFNGAGRYTFRGFQADTLDNPVRARELTATGAYTVGSTGMAEIQPMTGDETIFAAVGAAAVVGSMTEAEEPRTQDIFVAIPAPRTAVGTSAIQGRYLGGTIDFLGGRNRMVRSAQLVFSANAGAITDFTAIGVAANLGMQTQEQAITGATYTLTGTGSGTLMAPIPGGDAAANARLIGGQKTLWVSSDGELLLGGSTAGFDMIVAFKAPAAQPALDGLYFVNSFVTGPLDVDESVWASYGSANYARNVGIWHERVNWTGGISYDYTYTSTAAINADGRGTREFTRFAVSDGGRHMVTTGLRDNYALFFATRARGQTGTGVFINPVGVVNAASFAPITNPLAPGELFSIFGSQLANSTVQASSLPFPKELAGVRVTVNGRDAAILSVSPGQIAAVAPYEIEGGSTAEVRVINNGRQSNVVTVYTSASAPGIFTLPPGGVGQAAVLRPDYSIVSQTNPARIGETVAIFLTGLGTVDANVEPGAAGPTFPLAWTDNVEDLWVYIGEERANVTFAGLAPGLGGLYQLNATIPGSVEPGEVEIGIDLPGVYHTQTTIHVTR